MNEALINVWNNLYPAIIGGFITWAYTQIIEYKKRKDFEDRFSYTGKYISIFEDIENNKTVYSSSFSYIEQKGRKITGKNILGDRAWHLEGGISNNGYIYGEYYAELESDTGIGNFFLQPKINGDLEGLWAGFDSVNNIVSSGRYIFMKQPEFNIEKMSDGDINVAIDIVDSVLGKNYVEAEKFIEMINCESFVCLKAIVKNKVVGIALGCVLKIDDAINYLKIQDLKIPNIMKHGAEIAIIKTIAINESFQKRGIGTRFVNALEEIFKSKNIHVIASVAWRHDGIENIGGIMKKNEYKSIYIIDNYWKEDSIKEGFSCPVCGDNGCNCSANIYMKVI